MVAVHEAALGERHGVPARVIGTVREERVLRIAGRSDDQAWELVAPLARLDEAYFETIPRIMGRAASAVVAAATESPV